MQRIRMDIAILSETKKGKGCKDVGGYVHMCSGIEKSQKGKSMIATLTPEKDAIAEREKGKISSARIKSVTRKIVQSSDESSEEGDNEMELQGSDTSEQSIQELLDVNEKEGFGDLEREPNEGDYVLVEFTAQRKKKIF
ncbi:hypothetical protein FQA39_LY18861 [Lamprigera yunnana]|nr:hypothetical protein FQA39_LY18861 [Lamprigera yunnana]